MMTMNNYQSDIYTKIKEFRQLLIATKYEANLGFDIASEMYIDELIWGHSFYDEQTTELTMLEFLNVYIGVDNKLANIYYQGNNTLIYKNNTSLRVRELVFNDPYLEYIYKSPLSNKEKWKKWRDLYKSNALFSNDIILKKYEEIFADFDKFAETILLIKTSSIAVNTEKRWTSKFFFPIGKNSLFCDCKLNISKEQTTISLDRRFFHRTGELLYLMLCRSNKANILKEKIDKNLLHDTSGLDNIIHRLQDPFDNEYLDQQLQNNPLIFIDKSNIIFDRLAQQWCNILDCKLPAADKIYVLSQIALLNIIIYFLQKSKDILGDEIDINFVCEIVSKKNTKIKRLASDRYIQNNSLSTKAIEVYIDHIKDTPEWIQATSDEEKKNVIIKYCVLGKSFVKKDNFLDKETDLDTLLEELKSKCVYRHIQHLKDIHRNYAKDIGLASSVGARRYRYIISDNLVKALVIANVKDRMVFQEFMDLLYENYNIVIGDKQIDLYTKIHSSYNEDFIKNVNSFKEQLKSLALLQDLSDSYSYVINPFANKIEE